MESGIIKLDCIRGLFLLRIRLLLFLQFLNEPWQTLGMGRGKMIFLAEVQVVAKPFPIRAVQGIWNGPLTQMLFKLCLQCGRNRQHIALQFLYSLTKGRIYRKS